MEAVLREVRQLLSTINETVRNSKKVLVLQSEILDTLKSIDKSINNLTSRIEKLEKSIKH